MKADFSNRLYRFDGTIDVGAVVDEIEQPAEPGAVGNVFFHLLLEILQAVRVRPQRRFCHRRASHIAFSASSLIPSSSGHRRERIGGIE